MTHADAGLDRTRLWKRRIALAGAILLIVGGPACGRRPEPPQPPPPKLSVVTANMVNAANVGSHTWPQRIDDFAAAISSNPPVPDIISMTESAGLWHCSAPTDPHADDYDLVDRLLSDLRKSTGVSYRVAYLVGAAGNINNPFGTPLCWYYSGDTLLYNPSRLRNLTPDDVAGKPQERHDGPLLGFQIRRSLPLCERGSHLEPLDQLIDGPPQRDRCNIDTPSGPAYIQLDKDRSGQHALVASLARFSLVEVQGSSFDVVTVHPESREEELHAEPINDFISGVTAPRYRSADPYWPVIVVGDFNILDLQAWPRNTTQVAMEGTMAAAIGSGVGRQPTHALSLASAIPLPNQHPCALPETNSGFADHCGLLLRFSSNATAP
jgi:hypothetical protein